MPHFKQFVQGLTLTALALNHRGMWVLGDALAFRMTTASGHYTTHGLMFGITFQNNYMSSPARTGMSEKVKSGLPVLTNKVNFAYLY